MIRFKKYIYQIPRSTWILSGIVLIGIFLRTYNFHDWLRFNADQSRDAGIISQAIAGQEPLPLLGPKAGGTDFRLGPIFYEFQYFSARIFGGQPDKMAYPDLFFSILSIPLLYFLSRRFFSADISLGLAALYSFSFFAIKYSRFAWNPNSTPFWTMLFFYSIAKIMDSRQDKKTFWIIAAGIALGVCVQLHTFLLIILPVLLLSSAVYFSWKISGINPGASFGLYLRGKPHGIDQRARPPLAGIKGSFFWKNAILVFLLALAVNIPQLYGEYQTKGENIKAFFATAASRKEQKQNILGEIGKTAMCFMGANNYILSSIGSADECRIYNSKDSLIAKTGFALAGIIIFFGGLALAIYYLIKSKNVDDNLLLVILAYLALSFLLFVPLIGEISMRYFLILGFMPFLLLGFCLKFMEEKFKAKFGKLIAVFIILILSLSNLATVLGSFREWDNYNKTSDLNFDNTTLKEVELMSGFIRDNSAGQSLVYMDGNNTYLFKFEKSINYFTSQSGITVDSGKKAQNGDIVFQLIPTKNVREATGNKKGFSDIINQASFGRFTMLKFIKN